MAGVRGIDDRRTCLLCVAAEGAGARGCCVWLLCVVVVCGIMAQLRGEYKRGRSGAHLPARTRSCAGSRQQAFLLTDVPDFLCLLEDLRKQQGEGVQVADHHI